MDRRQVDAFAFMIAVTCFTAPMAAAMLGYIAHYNFWAVPAGNPHPGGSRRSHHRSRHRYASGN
jgi:hypothetical protein